MKKKDYIKYWISTSDKDFLTMRNLFMSGDYNWSLFIGHLVIEKLLKALYIKMKDSGEPPRTHDLLLIAERAGIETSKRQKDLLDLITTFNIGARYPDYKNGFYNKCNREYADARIREIKELREWLIPMIEKI